MLIRHGTVSHSNLYLQTSCTSTPPNEIFTFKPTQRFSKAIDRSIPSTTSILQATSRSELHNGRPRANFGRVLEILENCAFRVVDRKPHKSSQEETDSKFETMCDRYRRTSQTSGCKIQMDGYWKASATDTASGTTAY